MSVQDMIRLLYRWAPLNKPWLRRWTHIWEFSGAKTIGSGLQRCGRKWYVQMSYPSPCSPRACTCGVHQEDGTGLNAWPRQWVRGSGGSVRLSRAFSWHDPSPLDPSAGRVPANQYFFWWCSVPPVQSHRLVESVLTCSEDTLCWFLL